METNYIKQGDCLELMSGLPNESVDLVLCDPPYGETGNRWDVLIDSERLFSEYRRLIKPDGAIVLFGSFRLGSRLLEVAPDLYKYEWVWEKENGTNAPNVNYQPFRVHEYVFVFSKGRCTNGTRPPMKYHLQKTAGKPYKMKSGRMSENWKGGLKNVITDNPTGERHPRTVQRFDRDSEKLHPTQKPVELLRYLIRTYTDKGALVLDNCMGSGSTCVAAIREQRRYIGYELSEKYFNIAQQRINEEKSRIVLF